MKTVVILAVCVSAFLGARSDAAPLKASSEKSTVLKTVRHQTMVGKVTAVAAADAKAGTRAELALVDANGRASTFAVSGETAFYTRDWKYATIGTIRNGQTVKVTYRVAKDGMKEALSVSVVQE